jgi:hypothetical protein
MFVKAIEEVARFTMPVQTIDRVYGSETVRPGAATLFYVNEDAVAITCNHVANLIPDSDKLLQRYAAFNQAKNALQKSSSYNKKVKELIAQYDFDGKVCERRINITGVEGAGGFTVIPHPTYDLAIIKLHNPKNHSYSSYARFLKNADELKQGLSLCKLGYPFPSFTNFEYDKASDSIRWTATGNPQTPRFPLEGMLTRHMNDEHGNLFGFETSTPGLKGQSGGPVFNKDGIVCGMQFATQHLHLGFDMKNTDIVSNGEKIRIQNSQPFLHTGFAIHVNVIKDFLRLNGVKFYEG